jgi:hypothetical protein
MVIHDLHVVGVALAPYEADAPLVVDSDAVLTLPVAFQRLQLVSGEGRKRPEVRLRVQHVQLAKSRALDGLESPHSLPAKQPLGVGATEGPDHRRRVYRVTLNVNQYRTATERGLHQEMTSGENGNVGDDAAC